MFGAYLGLVPVQESERSVFSKMFFFAFVRRFRTMPQCKRVVVVVDRVGTKLTSSSGASQLEKPFAAPAEAAEVSRGKVGGSQHELQAMHGAENWRHLLI